MSLSKTDAATILLASPPLKRLQANLQDLIIIALEAYTKTHGNSYTLTRLQYVSDERHESRFCMHFDALAKDPVLNENTPLSLTIAVEIGEGTCFRHL